MILIWITLLTEILLDWLEFKQRNRVSHARGVVMRLITIAVLFVMYPGQDAVVLTMFMVAAYLMVFDHAIGYIIGGNIFYIGNTAKWDRVMRKVPAPILLFLRIFFSSILTAFYFFPEEWNFSMF